MATFCLIFSEESIPHFQFSIQAHLNSLSVMCQFYHHACRLWFGRHQRSSCEVPDINHLLARRPSRCSQRFVHIRHSGKFHCLPRSRKLNHRGTLIWTDLSIHWLFQTNSNPSRKRQSPAHSSEFFLSPAFLRTSLFSLCLNCPSDVGSPSSVLGSTTHRLHANVHPRLAFSPFPLSSKEVPFLG